MSCGTGSRSCSAAAAGDLSAVLPCVCVCEQVLTFAKAGLWLTKWVPGALLCGCIQSVLLHTEEATLRCLSNTVGLSSVGRCSFLIPEFMGEETVSLSPGL